MMLPQNSAVEASGTCCLSRIGSSSRIGHQADIDMAGYHFVGLCLQVVVVGAVQDWLVT